MPVALLAGSARSIGRVSPRVSGTRSAYHCRIPVNLQEGGGAAPRAPLAGAQRVEASLPQGGGGARTKAPGPRGRAKTAPMRAGRAQACDTAGAAHGLQGRTARLVRRLRRTIRGRSGCASPRGLHPPQPARGTAVRAACHARAPANEPRGTKPITTSWRSADREERARTGNSPNAGAGAEATWGGWWGRSAAGGP